MDERYQDILMKFWQLPINPIDTRLYLYLVHSCYLLGWKEPFGHSDRHLAAIIGVAVNTIRSSKERLQEAKLIAFMTPENKSKGKEGQTKFYLTVSIADTVGQRTVSIDDTVKPSTVSMVNTVEGKIDKSTVSIVDTVTDTVDAENDATVSVGDTVDPSTVSMVDTNYINTYTHYTIPDEAVASSGFKEEPKNSKRKKEKNSSAGAAKKLFSACMDIYSDWFKDYNDGEVPKIDGAAGKALKSIIAHLQRQVKLKNEQNKENNQQFYIEQLTDEVLTEKVLESWQLIFNHWHHLDNWMQSKTRLVDINSQFQNITTQIRHGITNTKSRNNPGKEARTSAGKGATLAQILALKRDPDDDFN